MGIRYGEILSAEESTALDEELRVYWRERSVDEKALKKVESQKKKRARNKKACKTYYVRTVAEAKEQRRLAWHAARARKREERAAARKLAEASVICRSLGLKTDEEIKVFMAIREIIPAQVVHALTQAGFLTPPQVEPALVHLAARK